MSETPLNCHLVVLSHGLWGTSDHFNYIEKKLINCLRLKYPEKIFSIYKTKSNEKFKTYDGIDLCGTRVAEEILIETSDLLKFKNLLVNEISIIGYSLGGLIARFAIGILTFKNYFDSVDPINFVTFCTPHVGVLTPGNSFSIKCFNNFVPYLLGNSGKQMFLKDSVNLENLPLLKLMATKNSFFFKGLKKFKYHALYSNIRSDIRSSWWTSGISFINPFEILDKNSNVSIDSNGFINFSNGSKFQLSFLDDYNPIILDINKPIKFNSLIDYNYTPHSKPSSYQTNNMNSENYLRNFLSRKFKWLILLFHTFIYIPMWVIWFISFNILQLLTSFLRVTRESSKLKEHSYIYNFVDKVAVPNSPILTSFTDNYSNEFQKFENELHDQGDFFLDSVFDAVTSSKNNNKSIFNQEYNGNKILLTSIKKLCSIPIDEINNWQKDYKLLSNSKDEAFEYFQILKSFKLNLSPVQAEIIKNLNTLNWAKFPIYITKTNATHAAAIVRHKDSNFDEGKIVVEHFCNCTFKID